MGSLPDNWRIELLYRAGDIEGHPGPKRAFSSRGRDVRDIHGVEEPSITVSMTWVTFCVQSLRSCFASGTLGPGQTGTLISGLRHYVLLVRSCGAALEDLQTVFRRSWRVH